MCICVDYTCILLYGRISDFYSVCVCVYDDNVPHSKFEVVSRIYELQRVAKENKLFICKHNR